MKGHWALIELVKWCKEDEGWKDLDKDEKDWLIKNLADSKKEKASKKNITHVATDIQGTMARINPKVSIKFNHSTIGHYSP